MDKDTKKEFEDLKKFLRKYMVTKTEVKAGLATLATKEQVNKLTNSVDSYAKQSKDYYLEMKVLRAQVQSMQQWIKQAAPKLGIEYKV